MNTTNENEFRFPSIKWIGGSPQGFEIGWGLLIYNEGCWVVPSFQRPLVWTEEQKIKFIESVILGLPIGEYTLHRSQDFLRYEVLDGQQRWNAIFEYISDKFPVFGFLYSELSKKEQRFFKSRTFSCREVQNLTEEEKLDVYERLAYGGTAHEPKK